MSNGSASDSTGVKVYLACPLHIRWTISTPERIVAAQVIDLKPSMDQIRRLMRRWSCSMRLFRYWLCRMPIGFSVRHERSCNRLSGRRK